MWWCIYRVLPEEGDTTDATASGGVDPGEAERAEAERTVEKAEQEDTAAVEMRAESLFQERLESHIHAIQTEEGEEEVDWTAMTDEGAAAPPAREAEPATEAPTADEGAAAPAAPHAAAPTPQDHPT